MEILPHASGSRVPAAMSYHNGRNLGIFRNGEWVRTLRTGSGSLVICPRIRENLTMENGDAAASWKDPASYLWIMAEIQGKVANGELPATPGAPCIVLPFIPEIRDIFAMENGSRALDQAAACWNRCITWSTDGQWSNGGWRSPLMQSSRTSDPG